MKQAKDSELEKSIDNLAARCVELRLDSALEFLIESHLPISTFAHTAHLFLEPMSRPFLGADRNNLIREFLSSRDNLELLSARIEHHRNLIAK